MKLSDVYKTNFSFKIFLFLKFCLFLNVIRNDRKKKQQNIFLGNQIFGVQKSEIIK